ncbi:MAG: hypothetical protein GVY08_07705 [Bacteroidetes bacterium]|jgi:hypothetical protein|nr:hypothetical protein [Bacteroidota bacterium]
MKKYFLFFFFVVLISCTNQDKSLFESNDFPKIDSKVIIDNDLKTPFKSLIENNTLYITDRSNRPSIVLYDISDVNDTEFINGLGREGRGGGEFLAPDFLLKNPTGESVYVFDAGGRKLVHIDENNEIQTEDLSFRLNGMPTNLHAVDSTIFIATGIIPESRFSIVEIVGTDIVQSETIGDYISLGENFSGFHEANAWRSQSTYQNSENKIALFSSYAKRADLLHTNGELLETVKDKNHDRPKVSITDSEFVFEDDAVIGYVSVTSDEDFIYALYSGQNYGNEGAGNGQYLHVFDWDLNFISGFHLDHFSLNITVDENMGIYSTQQNPDVAIRFFDLSNKI